MKFSASMLVGVIGALLSGAAEAEQYLVTVAPADRPKGYGKVIVSKATHAGTPIRLWANTSIDPDCSPRTPGATLAVVDPPAHGAASISTEPFFFAFPPTNPRSACNSRKVPGNQAFYTAEAGYRGKDRLVLEGSSPDGFIRRITVDIDVR